MHWASRRKNTQKKTGFNPLRPLFLFSCPCVSNKFVFFLKFHNSYTFPESAKPWLIIHYVSYKPLLHNLHPSVSFLSRQLFFPLKVQIKQFCSYLVWVNNNWQPNLWIRPSDWLWQIPLFMFNFIVWDDKALEISYTHRRYWTASMTIFWKCLNTFFSDGPVHITVSVLVLTAASPWQQTAPNILTEIHWLTSSDPMLSVA